MSTSGSGVPRPTAQESNHGTKKNVKRKKRIFNGWGNSDDDDGWGGFGNYMIAKQRKLNDQFLRDCKGQSSCIFSGIIIYVNGFTNPSSDELRRLMQEHGGGYDLYLRKSRITHIIASNLPNSKFKLAKTIPVVKPEWITDCVNAGKRLSHIPYLLLGNQSQIQPGHSKFSNTSPFKSGVINLEEKEQNMTLIKKKIFEIKCNLEESVRCNSDANSRYSSDGSIALYQNESLSRITDKDAIIVQKDNINDNVEDNSEKEIISNSEDDNEDDSLSGTNRVAFERKGLKSKLHVYSLTETKSCYLQHPFKYDCSSKSSEFLKCESLDDNNILLQDQHLSKGLVLNNSNLCVLGHKSKSLSTSKNLMHSLIKCTSTSSNSDRLSKLKSSSIADANRLSDVISTNKNDADRSADFIPTNKIDADRSDDFIPTNKTNAERLSDFKTIYASNTDKSSSFKSSRSCISCDHPEVFKSPLKSLIPKTSDKNFLNEFYSNSRLHHISKWKAQLKAYVADLHKSETVFPRREQLRQAHIENVSKLGQPETLVSSKPSICEQTVMHIDMDSFFVSVGLLSRPELKDQPVAVTHFKGHLAQPSPDSNLEWEESQWLKKQQKILKGKTNISAVIKTQSKVEDILKVPTGSKSSYSLSEIASCSYQARQAGVKNGMFMGQALRLCPNLQTIPYDFEAYNRVSRAFYDVVASFTHDIEAVSCDEMFIDVTDILTDTGATAMELASVLRAEVKDKTGCSASVGIGPNMLLARLATRKAKPCGQYQVLTLEAKEFIQELSVRDLPGIGYSLANKLSKLGATTCGQLQKISQLTLQIEFGPKMGELLHRFSLGQDDRQVQSNKLRKSVSAEVNYGIRFSKEFEMVNFLQEMASEVKKRMDTIKVKGRGITLKLMVRRPDAPKETAKYMGHGICTTLNKSCNLPIPTNDVNVIAKELISMYRALHLSVCDIRGVGIQINKLDNDVSAKGNNHKDGQRHQSILSFTTVNNKNRNTSPCSTLPKTCTEESNEITFTKITAQPDSSIKTFTLVQSYNESRKILENNEHLLQSSAEGEHTNSTNFTDNENDKIIVKTNKKQTEFNKAGPSSMTYVDCSDNTYMLSESQLDPQVLKELPEDLAQEILETVRQRKKITTVVNSKHQSSDAIDLELPPASQVDVNCLQALPLSLQNELQHYYQQNQISAKKKHVFPVCNSPLKGQPELINATKKKGKKGRPPGKKSINFGSNIVKKAENVATGQSDFTIRHVQLTQRKHSAQSQTMIDQIPEAEDISLCNAKQVEEVRRLLKEWWDSCSEPQAEDIEIVTRYFIQLIRLDNLEQAYCILKFIKRTLLKLNNLQWKECMKRVITSVQDAIQASYKAQLKL
ncbi:DNA repair protein REV1-like isoform X2 [Biomphalaria glabrata]|uniref:DNA repair protein REV1 n=1 Tax=Biomphalaria glabrata TaxID=6526 RepID=A0A9W2YME9_BIOGL|nr:DNA repair protein REV1-like isoform X2 [Biomphalaria glabrata]